MQPQSVSVGLVALAVLLAAALGHVVSSPVVEHGSIPNRARCEPLMIPLCRNFQYNETIMPNLLNHHNQEDAALEIHQFYPLVRINCSPDMQFFLCSLYAPACTIPADNPIPPCRSLCVSAREGCEPVLNKFGMNWPEPLDCDKFPEIGSSQLCVGEKATELPSNDTTSSPNC